MTNTERLLIELFVSTRYHDPEAAKLFVDLLYRIRELEQK